MYISIVKELHWETIAAWEIKKNIMNEWFLLYKITIKVFTYFFPVKISLDEIMIMCVLWNW